LTTLSTDRARAAADEFGRPLSPQRSRR
jgi:hypothetical protein